MSDTESYNGLTGDFNITGDDITTGDDAVTTNGEADDHTSYDDSVSYSCDAATGVVSLSYLPSVEIAVKGLHC